MDADEFQHEELTSRIIECAFTVQNALGAGFLEKVYENALAIELQNHGLKVQQQKPLQVQYKGNIVGDYVADMVVADKVILEIKAIRHILPAHEVQLVNYLRATGIELGLLINFAGKVEVRRRILSKA
jgi:GxxExxY protein